MGLISSLFRLPSQFIICTIAELLARMFLFCNNVVVEGNGVARFRSYLLERGDDVGLLTVSNHQSTLDDPFVLCSLTPFLSEKRWDMCAEKVCHKNVFSNCIVGMGNVVPVLRGAGIEQNGVDTLIHKLNNGKWVHIFPEGRIWQKNAHSVNMGYSSPSGQRRATCGRNLGPLKWGVGKIIAETKVPLIVLPFFHTGMDEAMPLTAESKCAYLLPSAGNNIHVIVGEPMQFDDLITAHRRDVDVLRNNSVHEN